MQESDEQLEARLKKEQTEREVLKQQLHQAEILYQWRLRKKKEYVIFFSLAVVFLPVLIGGLLFWLDGDWASFLGFALVGIVVCIIAGIELGPLAFAGAGAFALMSFGLTNYQRPEPDELIIYFASRYQLTHIRGKGVIHLSAYPREVRNTRTIYCDEDKKTEVLNRLQDVIQESFVVEIPDYKDLYKQQQFPE